MKIQSKLKMALFAMNLGFKAEFMGAIRKVLEDYRPAQVSENIFVGKVHP